MLTLLLVFWSWSCSQSSTSTTVDRQPPEHSEANHWEEEPWSDSEVRWEEIAHDCLELLASYREVDLSTASEAELVRQKREALMNEEICSQALSTSYRGPGGQVMSDHLARSLTIHALQAELAISSRYDSLRGYCELLEELIHTLDDDLTQINTGLSASSNRPEDMAMLLSLRELTFQSLQISLLDYSSTCR